jgi:hypothetical protein
MGRGLHGGVNYQSANDPRLHFGLGTAARVDRVEVRSPSGKAASACDMSRTGLEASELLAESLEDRSHRVGAG